MCYFFNHESHIHSSLSPQLSSLFILFTQALLLLNYYCHYHYHSHCSRIGIYAACAGLFVVTCDRLLSATQKLAYIFTLSIHTGFLSLSVCRDTHLTLKPAVSNAETYGGFKEADLFIYKYIEKEKERYNRQTFCLCYYHHWQHYHHHDYYDH